MLLALLDYTAYRMYRKRYASNAIEAKGGKLASVRNFPDDQMPKSGDIIVCHTRDSFLSWLVMYFTNSIWSHSATAVDHGDVVDLTIQGTVEHPFTDYLNDVDYVIVGSPLPLTSEQQAELVKIARSSVGVIKYSWLGTIKVGCYQLIGGPYAERNPRLYADVLMTLVAISWIGRKHRPLRFTCLSLGAVYTLTILVNAKRRKNRTYLRIADDLRRRIERGEFRPGDALPSIMRISQEYECAETTATKAVNVLKAKRLALDVQGSGMIVAARKALQLPGLRPAQSPR
jgi:DNA-binding transcriptional regulator YhcF (GntR family)